MNTRVEKVREALDRLKERLAAGEIEPEDYRARRGLLTEDLTVAERAELGLGTPTPQPVPGSRRAGRLSPMGPSGGVGGGARTALPRRALADFQPGETILGQWRLERELGHGGFGVVFEATDRHLGQKQAVKILDPAMVENADLLARFRREVLVLRRLVHPRIVRVFDYREAPEEALALLSMELVSGCSLRELKDLAKAEQRQLPLPQVLAILSQTLEALAAAHTQGVIHRDVSPGNVLLDGGSARELLDDPDRDPQVKLVDFGIAGLVERSELSAKSRALGTAAYVAPEVLDLATLLTPAVDVYSVGAMGYELLTGRLPLGRFQDPANLRPELSAQSSAWVLSMLETEPAGRPTASEARSASASCGGGPSNPSNRRHPGSSAPAKVEQVVAVTARSTSTPEPGARAMSLEESAFRSKLEEAIESGNMEEAQAKLEELEQFLGPRADDDSGLALARSRLLGAAEDAVFGNGARSDQQPQPEAEFVERVQSELPGSLELSTPTESAEKQFLRARLNQAIEDEDLEQAQAQLEELDLLLGPSADSDEGLAQARSRLLSAAENSIFGIGPPQEDEADSEICTDNEGPSILDGLGRASEAVRLQRALATVLEQDDPEGIEKRFGPRASRLSPHQGSLDGQRGGVQTSMLETSGQNQKETGFAGNARRGRKGMPERNAGLMSEYSSFFLAIVSALMVFAAFALLRHFLE